MVVGMRATNRATRTAIGDAAAGIAREARDRRDGHQEDDRQPREQHVERDLVGRLLRSAPSTSVIIRSRKVEPGAAVIRTTIQSDRTCVPPVTAERSPPDSRMTGANFAGDRRLVDRGHALDDFAIRRDDVARLDQDDVAKFQVVPGTGCNSRPAVPSMSLACVSVRVRRKCIGLRLAATFGHRLGEVREQDREPEPEDDLEREAEILAAGHEIA